MDISGHKNITLLILPPNRDLIEYISKIEREMILNALRDCHGVKQRAADQLKIKASTLYYKMEKYGIEEDEYL